MPEITPPTSEKSIVEVFLGPDGLPSAGAAIGRVEAPPAKVFGHFRAIERYPGRVPMIHKTTRHGNRVTVELRFKVALFSAKFEFTAEIVEVPDQSMELRFISGEPHGLRIRHDLTPLDDGRATEVRTHVCFDLNSLGWLVKFFLRHHPEIQFGVFSGTALALQHSLKRAVAADSPPRAHWG